jgi:hypothetical protein
VICPVWAVNPQLPVRTRTAPITTVPIRTLADVIGPPLFRWVQLEPGDYANYNRKTVLPVITGLRRGC